VPGHAGTFVLLCGLFSGPGAERWPAESIEPSLSFAWHALACVRGVFELIEYRERSKASSFELLYVYQAGDLISPTGDLGRGSPVIFSLIVRGCTGPPPPAPNRTTHQRVHLLLPSGGRKHYG
jgi:hypothetical protein